MSPSALPMSLQQNPQLDDWIHIDAADTITVRTGKVELGQGILTALALIAAEELDVELRRIRIESADSARRPIEFLTVGSMSVETSGAALRLAAAQARRLLLEAAAAAHAVPVGELHVVDGEIRTRAGQVCTNYWRLWGGRRFERAVSSEIAPKDPQLHRLVGRPAERIDIADTVFGQRVFVNDLTRPHMLHARVVRSDNPHATLQHADLEAVRALPGVVEVVRDGSFLGVLAAQETQAIAAGDRLRELAVFGKPHGLVAPEQVHEQLRQRLIGSYPLQDGLPVAQPVPPRLAPSSAVQTLRASYTRPYLMHASIGPSAALARYADGGVEVWCASQGVGLLALAIAQVLELEREQVRAIHVPGAGCYGHNGSDDAALDAALLARAVPGRWVRLIWSRGDEHAHEPYGPAMRVDVEASLDSEGRVVGYSHDVYSCTHIGRAFAAAGSCALLAGQELAAAWPAPAPRPMLAPQAGLHRNAWPSYDFPAPRVIKHLAENFGPRTSSLRSLGAFGNVFAIESMMDELAAQAGRDPVAFRLAHLSDARAADVIRAGARRARFLEAKAPGSEQRPRGRGMAFCRYENSKSYAAVFVELEVDLSGPSIHLLHAVIAADAGQIIDPDGLENQLEGGFIQAASWTLKEHVTFDTQRITSLDWMSYPILRFDEVPTVETVLLDRPDRPSLGAGEATTGPTPAAIANALFDACGVRLRDTPFTNERLRAALYAG